MTGDRVEHEAPKMVVEPAHTGMGYPVTMYLHSPRQVADWLEHHGFHLIDTLEFSNWMDRERTQRFPTRAYIAQKQQRPV